MWRGTSDQQNAYAFRMLKTFLFFLSLELEITKPVQSRSSKWLFSRLCMNGSGTNAYNRWYTINRNLLSVAELETGHALLHWSGRCWLTWFSFTHLYRSLMTLLFPVPMVLLLVLSGRTCLTWKLESLVFGKERRLSYFCWDTMIC